MIDRLASCYTSVVHDVLRAMGRRNFTLPPRLRPLNPEGVLTGPAFTIEGRLDETADPHETLLAWTGLLSQAKTGHVWVSQPHNHLVAQMGELSAETLHRKGVLGLSPMAGCATPASSCGWDFPAGARSTPRAMLSAAGCPPPPKCRS